MKKREYTKEPEGAELIEAFLSSLSKRMEAEEFTIWCGKEQAIDFAISNQIFMMEQVGTVTNEEKKIIRSNVEREEWPTGIYRITIYGIEYMGESKENNNGE